MTSDISELVVVAESRVMIWNAVAVYRNRIFVSGPVWSGSKGPSLAQLVDDVPQPYGGDAWININAIHLYGSSLYVVDTGTPVFGGNPVGDGARIVQIDLETDTVRRVYTFPKDVVKDGSYTDDIRINGKHGYITDAGNAGIIVLDLETGASRRVLDGHPSTVARPDRPIVVDGETVIAPDGKPLLVQSDPLELSADGRWFYYGPLEGPWSRIETRFLDDPSLSAAELGSKVEFWADIPPIGGSALAENGDFYFTDLNACALKRRDPRSGEITTLLRDKVLHWVDAPFLDEITGVIYLPIAQLDRAALFHEGKSEIQWPIQLCSFAL